MTKRRTTPSQALELPAPAHARTLYGVRSWTADPLGRLVGAQSHTWTRGVQVAECKYPLVHRDESMTGCICGFYALTDGGDGQNHVFAPEVTGIVRGHGEVVVGKNGWRASRAEIIALVVPRAPRVRLPEIPAGVDVVVGVFGMVVAVAGLIVTLGCLIDDGSGARSNLDWTFTWLGIPLGLFLLRWAFFAVDPPNGGARTSAATLRRNYPDVQIFPSLKKALAAVPVTPYVDPVVTDPDLELFWTQDVSGLRRSGR